MLYPLSYEGGGWRKGGTKLACAWPSGLRGVRCRA